MLSGKRVLITGVVNAESIAFAAAERAQLAGAEIVLTGFDRDLERTRETAALLPRPADVLELDATRPDHFDRLTAELRERLGALDGALHAVAFAPRDALAGDFMQARPEGLSVAFQTSAVSLSHLGRVLRDLAPPEGGSIVALDFDADGRAWPVYNWMGVAKAAMRAVSTYLARDLGARGIRVNLVAAGPLRTRAANGIPDFQRLLDAFETTAPLRWDSADPAPVADAVCFLLSDWARAITAEVLHVDGGFHAMAAPLRDTAAPGDAALVPELGGDGGQGRAQP
jgi:enoyl-[acyl-carrier protein] reductase I